MPREASEPMLLAADGSVAEHWRSEMACLADPDVLRYAQSYGYLKEKASSCCASLLDSDTESSVHG